jgi:D-alanine-D-alanine ligase
MKSAGSLGDSQSDTASSLASKGIVPRRIALLAGGNSGEREVSLNSGANAAEALRSVGHQVTEIDTAKPNFISELVELNPDAVFIALHGQGGEDGQIQGLLELLGLPYTGSGVLASALSMNKPKAKILYRNAGLYTPDHVSVVQSIAGLKTAEAFIERYGLPCVVKPAADGSSIGVSIVRDMTEFNAALDAGFSVSKSLLVERYIAGIEVTVPVIGNDDPIALPVIEIVPVVSDFYDYEAKYSDGGSEHIIPARLAAELLAHVQDQALTAHKALGCEGVSRSDFIVDALGTAWIIETNTIPGMTKTSLLPEAARHVGIENGELYSRMIEWGIAAHSK